MSNSKIDLDFMAEQVLNEDGFDRADTFFQDSVTWVSIWLRDGGPELSTTDTLRDHPQLVGSHALVCAINEFEITYRTLKIEELRNLKNISNSLERLASAVEFVAKGKHYE